VPNPLTLLKSKLQIFLCLILCVLSFVPTNTLAASTSNCTCTHSPTTLTLSYDTHGNLTKLGNQSFKYDVSDRYRESSQAGVGYTYWVRDVEDRITLRSFNDTSYEYYNHSPSGVTVVRDGGWNIVEKRISLPGLQLTLKVVGASNSNVYAAEYTVSSSLGHTLVFLDATGNLAGSNINLHRFGPFGEVINQDPNSKYEYAGSAQRRTEAEYALKFVTMGARLYVPTLGRFLSVDPVKGGTQNDYVYVVDPIGSSDFSGKFLKTGWNIFERAQQIVNVAIAAYKWITSNPLEAVSFIPIIGIPASLKLADEDFKKGDYLSAVLNIAGVVPFGKLAGKGGKFAVGLVKGVSNTAKAISLSEKVISDVNKMSHIFKANHPGMLVLGDKFGRENTVRKVLDSVENKLPNQLKHNELFEIKTQIEGVDIMVQGIYLDGQGIRISDIFDIK
jgi:RHS repeat-associated protein